MEMTHKMGEWFKLTYEERNRRLASGQLVIYNRTGWALSLLKKEGLLNNESRIYFITDAGRKILAEGHTRIDRKLLRGRHDGDQESDSHGTNDDPGQSGHTPDERIESIHSEIRCSVESDLLDRIMKNDFRFFEVLVVELMRKMDYGVEYDVTQASWDGGIDGMVKQDKLGIEEIYLQAKRWGGPVPIGDVKEFVGTVAGQKSKKGVMITTSTFSKSAHKLVERAGMQIILIDGQELVEHMYEYGVGVTEDSTYSVKKIDESYFE